MKIVKICILTLIIIFNIFTVINLPNLSYADELDPYSYKPSGEIDSPTVTKYANKFTGILFSISVIVAVISIMIIGIKILVGSAEEKAEYKKHLMPVLIGIFIISFITAILSAIANLAGTLN